MDDTTRDRLDHLRLRTQADVQLMWELLMRPLGFGARSLWVTFIDPDGAPLKLLLEITDLDQDPTGVHVANLYDAIREAGFTHNGGAVAFLITLPGAGGLTDADRTLADLLLSGSRSTGVRCHPVHVANDLGVFPVAPDDLAA